jgi:hypothetical protein
MIEFKDDKEYWNGSKCDGNFVFRTLADMYPQDYERYIILAAFLFLLTGQFS